MRHKKGVANAKVRFLALEVADLCGKNHNLCEEMKRHDTCYFSEIRMLCKALQRIAAQPGRRMVPPEEGATVSTLASVGGPVAKLFKGPKFLHELWKEWIMGMEGKKAAKDFTLAQRGKNKSQYLFCKVFWDKIGELVWVGHTADRACDLIYEANGQRIGVTEIIKRMKTDGKARLWPDCIAVRCF